MTADDIGEYPGVAIVLSALSPTMRAEAQDRLLQGDIPYLLEHVVIEVDRVFFPGVGWITAPGIDPEELPLDTVEVLFVVFRGDARGMEMRLKRPTSSWH